MVQAMRKVSRWFAVVFAALALSSMTRAREPIIGACEGCEAVFEGLPDEIPAVSRIAPSDETGAPMIISGVVTDARGEPVPGIIVYAYQTNAKGIYPPLGGFARGSAALRHGRLRSWARTDAQGRYQFLTIRPGAYPGTDIPQHVHFHVLEPGRCTYYIDDLLFDDDPHLTPLQRRQLLTGRGGNGLAVPTRNSAGVWHVTRDIVLGARVDGYPPRR